VEKRLKFRPKPIPACRLVFFARCVCRPYFGEPCKFSVCIIARCNACKLPLPNNGDKPSSHALKAKRFEVICNKQGMMKFCNGQLYVSQQKIKKAQHTGF
jgi:hypothetical protein